MKQRVLSGIQPTGNLHLGNYLGAIRNWIPFQETHECLFCIVDLHALTVPPSPDALRNATRQMAAAYVASGIDPQKSHLFVQSHVPAHTQLSWLLSCYTPLGWLNRMTQFKEKAGKQKENAVLGLYAYPVLMAADILLYQASHVPVGEDQKQHLELARDIGGAFNHHYGKDFFKIPEPFITGVATRVMSLREGTAKMSKSDASDYSRIGLTDSAETLALKIRKAKTDPHPLPADPKELEGRPEAENLLSIYAALTGKSLEGACEEWGGAVFSTFKEGLTQVLVETLCPIGEEMTRLMADPVYLDQVLLSGATHAHAIGQKTVSQAYELVGIYSTPLQG
jgi:tryptophanyl-tRNA synthetase